MLLYICMIRMRPSFSLAFPPIHNMQRESIKHFALKKVIISYDKNTIPVIIMAFFLRIVVLRLRQRKPFIKIYSLRFQ